MSSILTNALSYTQQGISVIPSDPKTKLPYWQRLPRIPHPTQPGKTKATWKPYMKKIASMNRLQQWFQDGCLNITVVCGQVSGGLVVFDFDYDAAVIFPRWWQAIGPLAQVLVVVKSFKGYHVYLRVRGQRVPCQKIAFNEDGEVLIEIKGEGGVIQAPPSRHPSGCRYQWRQGNNTQIPHLTMNAYEHLLAEAQAFDRRPPKEEPTLAEMKAWRLVDLPQGSDLLTSRLHRYTESSVARECAQLAKTVQGSRNDELNKSAFRLGRFVGAGLLDEAQAYQALLLACETNGYIADDGPEAFRRTCHSGLSSGSQNGTRFLSELVQQLS
jgi:hypothetical protein